MLTQKSNLKVAKIQIYHPDKNLSTEKPKSRAIELSYAAVKRKYLREMFGGIKQVISGIEKWVFSNHLDREEQKVFEQLDSKQSMKFLKKITKEEIDIMEFRKNNNHNKYLN